MREIGFRVYIKPLKRYAKDYETILYHHQCNMKPTWTVNISPEEYYGDEDLIIEQDTGLKDKNGKKIYEGGIVRRVEDGGFDTVGAVEWGEKAARFWVNRYYYPNGKKWEVIGNIHENGDLLKGAK